LALGGRWGEVVGHPWGEVVGHPLGEVRQLHCVNCEYMKARGEKLTEAGEGTSGSSCILLG
jgi:hypothetical protein